MIGKSIPAFVVLVFVLISPMSLAQMVEPGEIVEKTVNDVLSVLRDSSLSEDEKKTRTYAIVQEHINFTGMSRRILALHWKKADDKQKAKFESLFKELLLDTYWQRIKKYRNESVEFITGMIEGNNYATIDTVIISSKIEIPITYRMEFVEGEWMAYDFLIESLSLVTSYRNEYRNLIKLNGIDGLLQEMERQVKK